MFRNLLSFQWLYVLSFALYFVSADRVNGQNKMIDSLKIYYESINTTDTLSVNLLIRLGQAYWNVNPDTADVFFAKALRTAKAIDFQKGIAGALNGIGVSFFFRAEYDSAIHIFNEVILMAKANHDLKNLANAYGNLGNIYNNLGGSVKALHHYLKSKEVLSRSQKNSLTVAFINLNIGKIYTDQGNLEPAKRTYLQALETFRTRGLPQTRAIAAHSLGGIYRMQDSLEQAFRYFDEALEVASGSNDSRNIAATLTQMGEANIQKGEYAKALDNYLEARKLFEEINDSFGMVNAYLGMADIYNLRKEHAMALEYAIRSQTISKENSYLPEYADALRVLHTAYKALGNHERALEYALKRLEVKDSLVNVEQTRKLAMMESAYEIQSREQEITLLEKENRLAELHRRLFLISTLLLATILLLILFQYRQRIRHARVVEEKNDLLSQTMASKERLFSIIAHDLKSPLSTLSTMSATFAQNIDVIKKERIVTFFHKFEQSSRNLSGLLNNLLEWSLTQTGTLKVNIETLNIKQSLENAIKPLTDLAESRDIRLCVESEGIEARADAKMLETALRNIISNALKFTDPGGEVRVYATKQKDRIAIAIQDTGIGMDEKEAALLFDIRHDPSKIGRHQAKGTGLGLVLSKELMEKNHGDIRVESEKGKGSTFYITLPSAA